MAYLQRAGNGFIYRTRGECFGPRPLRAPLAEWSLCAFSLSASRNDGATDQNHMNVMTANMAADAQGE